MEPAVMLRKILLGFNLATPIIKKSKEMKRINASTKIVSEES